MSQRDVDETSGIIMVFLCQHIISEFNKEQEEFIKAKGGSVGEAIPPWVGYPKEEELKKEIMELSTVSVFVLFHRIIAFCARDSGSIRAGQEHCTAR